MQKLWITLVLDGKITNDCVVDWPARVSTDKGLHQTLDEACAVLDLSRPIIMKKHIHEINSFNRTQFLPEHFIEGVNFDKMVLELFETDKRPKSISKIQ